MMAHYKHRITNLILLELFLCLGLVITVATLTQHQSIKARPVRSYHRSPIIKLIGKNPIRLSLGSKYIDPGATALESHGYDISSKISELNYVNIEQIGTYNVIYSVKDQYNNHSFAKREVDVVTPNTTGIPILMYHFFYDSNKDKKPTDNNFTDVNNFNQQMKYLIDNNYYFPTWVEINDYLDGKITLPGKSIVLTFDDGAESFFRLAYPVLVKYQIHATSFIITSWTNPKDLKVDRNLISFESHSNNMHRGGCPTKHGGIMQCITYQDGYQDLILSRHITGDSEVFCYPFGDYNDFSKQLLRDTGYIMAVTTHAGKARVGMDKLQLPRVRIQGSYSLDDFIRAIQ